MTRTACRNSTPFTLAVDPLGPSRPNSDSRLAVVELPTPCLKRLRGDSTPPIESDVASARIGILLPKNHGDHQRDGEERQHFDEVHLETFPGVERRLCGLFLFVLRLPLPEF